MEERQKRSGRSVVYQVMITVRVILLRKSKTGKDRVPLRVDGGKLWF